MGRIMAQVMLSSLTFFSLGSVLGQIGSEGWMEFPSSGDLPPELSRRSKFYRFGTRTSTSSSPPTTTSAPSTAPEAKAQSRKPKRRRRCGRKRKFVLKLMKKEGMYNPKYQADRIFEAATQFPDLTKEDSKLVTEEYTCQSDDCRRMTARIREEFEWFRLGLEGGRRPSPPPPPPTLPPQPRPAFISDHDRYQAPTRGLTSFSPSFSPRRRFTREARWQRRRYRGKRGVATGEELLSGLDRDLDTFSNLDGTSGLTILIDNDYEQPLEAESTHYQYAEEPRGSGLRTLCETKRGIRILPADFVPRYLNEVVCTRQACLKGQGQCAQRFLTVPAFKNVGTERCPKWRKVRMKVRVCCDCRVRDDSDLFRRFLQPPSQTWG